MGRLNSEMASQIPTIGGKTPRDLAQGGTPWWNTKVEPPGGTPWWNTLVEPLGGTPWWNTLVEA